MESVTMVTKTGTSDTSKQSSPRARLALASGVGFVVLLVAAGAMAPEPPGPAAPAAELANWFASNRDVALVQVYLRGLAALLMLVFVGGVVGVIERVQGGIGTLALLALGGGVMFATLLLLSNVAGATAALLAGQGGEPEVVHALHALGETMRYLNALSGALLIGAASAALLRARAVPRWVGWLGLVAVPVFLAGGAGFPGTRLEPLNFIAFPFVLLWPLVLSIALLRRSATGHPAPRSPVAAAS